MTINLEENYGKNLPKSKLQTETAQGKGVGRNQETDQSLLTFPVEQK